ncbi:two-component sensor histidine kinase [Virgisporangium aliadipatigenens]|uniref:histidine kinase n=1 Tax=Virgisporangium aliadipatigenens TaxID=741659 RepID=A0A8J3YPR9_9ACTN|nr:PAS domain-containing sensor histidine kinase [Virgisporangium aliadipatigenens]GIJ49156.1 two-component sensor histidine kinase [Virgisporangium aliadipatigenens]
MEGTLAAVMGLVRTGLLVLDPDRRVTVANAAARELLGCDDCVGRPFAEVVGPTLANAVRDAGSGRWSPRHGVIVEWTWQPLPDGGYGCALRDVSRRLAERARLRRQNRALAELVAMKAEFVAAVSHELRTPVTSIAALAELLRDATTGPEDPMAGPLEAIDRNSRRLLILIENVTELARIEGETAPPPPAVVDLGQLVREAVQGWAATASDAEVKLSLAVGEPADVTGDPERLRRLCDAMLGLALAAAGPGEPVDVAVRPGPGERVLTVPIRGRGADRLFTGVAERHDSTALMLCRAIVARHRGRFTTRTVAGATELVAVLPSASADLAGVAAT